VTAPQHPGTPFFATIAEHLGAAYLRYEFTRGTAQECEFLLDLLDLPAGARVLDVGCGPGRHAVALARAGLAITGVDISGRFLELAADAARAAGVAASFFEVDARRMPFDDEFDAVLSICQGAFGLMGGDDSIVARRMAEAARPGGRVVLTTCNALFEARRARRAAHFDIDAGVVHEVTAVRDEAGSEVNVDLWTSVYTPRELRLLAIGVGLVPEAVWGVEPGDFARRPPDIERPELMLVARKPETTRARLG
jgi:SAM-dependent methyltransferase